MESLIQLFGALLVALGSLIILANHARQFRNFRNRKRGKGQWSSPAPFAGPLLIIAGTAQLPFELSGWIFLVFVLDPDTVIAIVSLPWLIRGFFR